MTPQKETRAFRIRRVILAAVAAILLLPRMAVADSVVLVWDPSPDPAVTGYVLYVGTERGALSQRYDLGLVRTARFDDARPGQLYCFAVTAYISSGVESILSNEECGYGAPPPVLENPGPQGSGLGEQVGLHLLASSPGGGRLSFGARGLPPGLTAAPTGLISGAATRVGTYAVTATAWNGLLASSQSFTWTVASGDGVPPTIAITAPTGERTHVTTLRSIAIGGVAADNVNVSSVTWSTNRGGSGVAAGTTAWSVASIPIDVGTTVITVTATDTFGNAATASLTVIVNAAPTLAGIENQSGLVGLATTLQLAGSDESGDRLTYGASGLPPGLELDASTGLIAGMPTTAGAYDVTAFVSDGSLSASQSFTWTVLARDYLPPAVTITSPTASPTFSTTDRSVVLGGTAVDNVGVTQVRWINSRGGSGIAEGTTTWSATVTLDPGLNFLIVTAQDAAGNVWGDTLMILAPLEIRLSADRVPPQRGGRSITFTASAGGAVPPYQYRWRVHDGRSWNVLHDWSFSSAYTWHPGSPNREYQIEVSVRSLSGERADAVMPFPID